MKRFCLSLRVCLCLCVAFIVSATATPAGAQTTKPAIAPVGTPTSKPASMPASSPAGTEKSLPGGGKVIKDIQYTSGAGKPQCLDLYLPASAKGKMPVVLWIHGGGWTAGNKEQCPAVFLLPKGYAVVSVDYRLLQDGAWPAQIVDCRTAVRWVRANAAKYNLDADRVGAWGASAGGHLVALLATVTDKKDWDSGEYKEQSPQVQAVVDFFGPTDLEKLFDSGKPREAAKGPMAKAFADVAKSASPMTYVSKAACPMLIMHGDKDTLVPIAQSETFYEALKAAGAEVAFEVVKGSGHGFAGPGIVRTVMDFFDRNIGAGAKPASRPTSDKAEK